MRKIRVLLASILIQSCLGGIYAWSAFSTSLCERYGLTSAQAGLIFGSTILSFTLAMVWAGRLLEPLGPRRVCAIGAVLYGSGHLLASFSSGSFAALFLCISLVAGMGIGFCYVCPLAACMRWFPRRKGLITGLTVAGFGAGGLVLANAVSWLGGAGADALQIFRWIGIVYGALILLGASQLGRPPQARAARWLDAVPPYREVLARKGFWALAVGMFTGTFGGLLVIGNLKPLGIASGLSAHDAALAVSLFAVGNAMGRVLWGALHDRLGRGVIPCSLALLALGILMLAAPAPRAGFFGLTLLVGFAFGGCFVLYAAELVSRHGPASVGRFYPLVYLAYGLAGFSGPATGGWLFDQFQSHLPAIGVGAGMVGLGALMWIALAGESRLGVWFGRGGPRRNPGAALPARFSFPRRAMTSSPAEAPIRHSRSLG